MPLTDWVPGATAQPRRDREHLRRSDRSQQRLPGRREYLTAGSGANPQLDGHGTDLDGEQHRGADGGTSTVVRWAGGSAVDPTCRAQHFARATGACGRAPTPRRPGSITVSDLRHHQQFIASKQQLGDGVRADVRAVRSAERHAERHAGDLRRRWRGLREPRSIVPPTREQPGEAVAVGPPLE